MRKLTIFIIAGILLITTSAWALTDQQIKNYVSKHVQITKKLKQIKDLNAQINTIKQAIWAKYNRAAMIAELQAIDTLYAKEKSTLNAEYKTLVEEIEILIP